jgi:hypothetical protein
MPLEQHKCLSTNSFPTWHSNYHILRTKKIISPQKVLQSESFAPETAFI